MTVDFDILKRNELKASIQENSDELWGREDLTIFRKRILGWCFAGSILFTTFASWVKRGVKHTR